MPLLQVHYSHYLKLDQILGNQSLKSQEAGRPCHDEMLFIIVHQTYELWFKQILFELDSILEILKKDPVNESEVSIAVSRLQRVTDIQKLLIDQVKILETMTPLDFLEFRDLLTPASGFQSLQFRMIETKLGLKAENRLTYHQESYCQRLIPEEAKRARSTEQEPSLLDLVDRWLSRMPFMKHRSFDFIKQYEASVKAMLARDRENIEKNTAFSDEKIKIELEKLNQVLKSVDTVFDSKQYHELFKDGQRSFSHSALMAALFINVYRDMPILHLPFKLLTLLMDVDELLTLWRYRHALMVRRMIGNKIGTGGSSGHDYLKLTVDKHKIYTDLFDLSTLFIPRSRLPKLPLNIIKMLDFHFSSKIETLNKDKLASDLNKEPTHESSTHP